MNFGEAIELLKAGKKVTRRGWNGKGMFLWLKPAANVDAAICHDPILKNLAECNGGAILALPTICMYTHDSTGRKAILTGWLASQSDMLGEDWEEVNEQQEFKDRKPFKVACAVVALLAVFFLAGCGTTAEAVTSSASGKNLGLDGYVMLGEIETVNPETATPQGKLIIGRVTYKSRKVGIPADQKVPTAGNFKATKTKSLFGTEEIIIEYDFTAGNDEDAKKALEVLEKKRKEAEKKFAEKHTGDGVNAVSGEAKP